MLKRICLFFLAFGISVSLFSQDLRFGIFVDPVISWLKPDVSNVDSKGGRLGINFGLMVDRFFAKNYALTTGISIHHAGGSLLFQTPALYHLKDQDVNTPVNTKVTFKLQYLDIPLGLKLCTNPIGYNTFFGQIGLNAMVNIKATGVSNYPEIDNKNAIKEINMLDLAYHIGGGIERSIGGNTRLMAGLTFMNGFTDVTKRGEDKVVLNNFILRLGVIF